MNKMPRLIFAIYILLVLLMYTLGVLIVAVPIIENGAYRRTCYNLGYDYFVYIGADAVCANYNGGDLLLDTR